jgi:hypothetical protein
MPDVSGGHATYMGSRERDRYSHSRLCAPRQRRRWRLKLARVEAWHQADRPALPATPAILVAMKSQNATRHTLAHQRPDRAHLHPSRRRVLAALVFGAAANQRKLTDSLGFARPFIPSSPRPDTRLRAERIGGFIRAFPATSPTHERRSRGPSPSGYDLHPASPSPGDRQPNRSGRSHTARTFAIHGSHKQMDTRPPALSLHRHPASMRVGQGVNRRLPCPKPITFAVGLPVKSALL